MLKDARQTETRRGADTKRTILLSIWGKWARPDYPNTTKTTIIHISAETTFNSEKNPIPVTKPLALIWSCLRPLAAPLNSVACGGNLSFI